MCVCLFPTLSCLNYSTDRHDILHTHCQRHRKVHRRHFIQKKTVVPEGAKELLLSVSLTLSIIVPPLLRIVTTMNEQFPLVAVKW